MNSRFIAPFVLVAVCIFIAMQACAGNNASSPLANADSDSIPQDSLRISSSDSISSRSDSVSHVRIDSLPDSDRETRYSHLTEEDFRIVAEELGVEVAAIKAVVEIEAGKAMKGFWRPGVPVVNFDATMCARYRKSGKATPDKSAKVPSGLSGYALKEWTQLVKACRIDSRSACLGTFWGMFQIGGFNYKKCGCESIEEFVRLMSYSEMEQLELFAAFVKNTGMVKYLREKNWAGFSSRFNGPSYKRRGYHTRMAAAYARYKKQS